MIRVEAHRVGASNFSKGVKGITSVPGMATKLVGVYVTSTHTITQALADSEHSGFIIKLIINNREYNPVCNHIHDGYKDVYDNVDDNKRFIPLDCDIKPSSKIQYYIEFQDEIPYFTIDVGAGPGGTDSLSMLYNSIKLYLKYE